MKKHQRVRKFGNIIKNKKISNDIEGIKHRIINAL